jgi:hypothetical protein
MFLFENSAKAPSNAKTVYSTIDKGMGWWVLEIFQG